MNLKEYFKDYIIALDEEDFDIEKSNASKNIEAYLHNEIKVFINATIIKNNGFRPITTIDKRYKIEISTSIRLLDEFKDLIDVEEWSNKIIKQHEKNIEFEKENPPERLIKRIKRAEELNKRSSRRNRQTSMFANDKEYSDAIKKENKREKAKSKFSLDDFTF